MTEIAGAASKVDRLGTFGWIVLPGVIAGGLLGWADHLRKTGGRPGWRWLALSLLLLSSAPFTRPGEIMSMLEDGIGFGAFTVPLFGMAGGYALSKRGPAGARCQRRARTFLDPGLGNDCRSCRRTRSRTRHTPRGLDRPFLLLFPRALSLASAIPHRPVVVPGRE
jgi:hypothetical protein